MYRDPTGAAVKGIHETFGEDAVRIFKHLYGQPDLAFGARNLFHEVFDPEPVLVGHITTNDEGEQVRDMGDRSSEFDDATERVEALCTRMEGEGYLQRRVMRRGGVPNWCSE